MAERRKFVIEHYENNVDFIPEYVEGEFDIPCILPEPYVKAEYIPFHMAGSEWYKRDEKGIHFFISDYRFTNLWVRKEKYRDMLKQFKVVMSPDFSPFYDWPIMVQRWNHYRKHVIGAWMQSIGCRVYPTITWNDERSYKWCFDGEPFRSTVCVSNVGVNKRKEDKLLFMRGYDKMMEVLEPETIIFYGSVPPECTGNIIPLTPFTRRLKECGKSDKA